MTFKTRRILFYSFFFLFILSGLGVVFYSQGWRVNLLDCEIKKLRDCQIKFQKTGAIFIQTKPKGVIIKIDGKIFQDKSGIIQSGTLITELLPKIYNVKIKKEGYLPWQKNLEVQSALVSELLKILLIPENLEWKIVLTSRPAHQFWISPKQNIVFQSNGILYCRQESNDFKLRGDKLIQWSEDGSKMLVFDSKNQIYYLYELNNLSKALNITEIIKNLRLNSKISKIAFHPSQFQKLIIQNNEGLYALDLERLRLENLIKAPLIAWNIRGSNIFYLKENENQESKIKNHYLASLNLILKSESLNELNSEFIDSKNLGADLEISVVGGEIILLNAEGGLYIFNLKTQNFEQIAHSAQKFFLSPDGRKIAFFDNDNKLNIYFLKDYQMGINKKAGEVISLNFYKDKNLSIKDIAWYQDSHYFFVEYLDNENNQNIDFVEIDNREPVNQYALLEKIDNFHYELKTNQLYFIKDNSLLLLKLE